jgi:hypothetical protein
MDVKVYLSFVQNLLEDLEKSRVLIDIMHGKRLELECNTTLLGILRLGLKAN